MVRMVGTNFSPNSSTRWLVDLKHVLMDKMVGFCLRIIYGQGGFLFYFLYWFMVRMVGWLVMSTKFTGQMCLKVVKYFTL